jgi:type III secretion system needle length determinant
MKIEQNQPPQAQKTGSADQTQEPGQVQGEPKASPFANILKKGKQGPGEEMGGMGGEGGAAGGEKMKTWGGPGAFPAVGKHPDKGAEAGHEKTDQLVPGLGEKEGGPKDPKLGSALPGGLNPSILKGRHKGEGGKEGQCMGHGQGLQAGPRRFGAAVITGNIGASGGAKPFDPKSLDGKLPGSQPRTRDPRPAEHTAAAPVTTPQTEAQVIRPAGQAAAQEVHATGSTAALAQMHALAGELVDKVQVSKSAAGDDRVEIQFNSKTLQGLEVSISQHEGKVSVQFNTANEQVSQMLTQNVQALTQALSNRGVDAEVRVAAPATNASDSGKGNWERDSGRGGRGGSGSGSGSSGGSGGSGQGEQRGGGR